MADEIISKIQETGVDSSLSATDLLIAVMEFLHDRQSMRLVIIGFEETEEEQYIHFTNARSQAEEAGIIKLCGKEASRLEHSDEQE